jgi:hypothetical protein
MSTALAAASFVVDPTGEAVHGNLDLVTVDAAVLIGWQAVAADLCPGEIINHIRTG